MFTGLVAAKGVVRALDGGRLEVETELAGELAPGDSIALVVRQRGREVPMTVRLVADPTLEVVRAEEVGEPLTEAQRAFRAAWLGSRAPSGARGG